jgi:hypothetical protein
MADTTEDPSGAQNRLTATTSLALISFPVDTG